jgi:CheY-like chemotaxis protein
MASPGGPPKRRILLVDDDASVRDLLEAVLTEAGFEVIAAGDGDEALRLWRKLNGADLAIVDMFMPRKDGIETIIELKTHSPAVPIIAMSGGGRDKELDILRSAKTLGAVLTLEKPFHTREILDLVTKALVTACLTIAVRYVV